MSPWVLWSKPSWTSCRSEMSPWGSLSTPLRTLNAVLQRQENCQQQEPCIVHKAALQACFYLEVDLKYSRAAALGCQFFSPDIRTVNGFMTVGSSLKPPLPSEKESLRTSLVRLFEFSEQGGPQSESELAGISAVPGMWRAPLMFMAMASPACQGRVQRKSRLQRPETKARTQQTGVEEEMRRVRDSEEPLPWPPHPKFTWETAEGETLQGCINNVEKQAFRQKQ